MGLIFIFDSSHIVYNGATLFAVINKHMSVIKTVEIGNGAAVLREAAVHRRHFELATLIQEKMSK
jgi:hypothetical protein